MNDKSWRVVALLSVMTIFQIAKASDSCVSLEFKFNLDAINYSAAPSLLTSGDYSWDPPAVSLLNPKTNRAQIEADIHLKGGVITQGTTALTLLNEDESGQVGKSAVSLDWSRYTSLDKKDNPRLYCEYLPNPKTGLLAIDRGDWICTARIDVQFNTSTPEMTLALYEKDAWPKPSRGKLWSFNEDSEKYPLRLSDVLRSGADATLVTESLANPLPGQPAPAWAALTGQFGENKRVRVSFIVDDLGCTSDSSEVSKEHELWNQLLGGE